MNNKLIKGIANIISMDQISRDKLNMIFDEKIIFSHRAENIN